MRDTDKGKDNPNRHKTLYLINIIVLSLITIASAVAALVLFLRADTLHKSGDGKFYTESEISQIQQSASADEKNSLLRQIQSSLEAGNSSITMLRDLYPDDLVVVSGGKYYFYPVDTSLKTNNLSSDDFSVDGNGTLTYTGDDDNLQLSIGIDVSADNGTIDWPKVAVNQVSFAFVHLGGRGDSGTIDEDKEFETNMRHASENGVSTYVSYDLNAVNETECSEDAKYVTQKLSEMGADQGDYVAVCISVPDDDDRTKNLSRDEWTAIVKSFCDQMKSEGYNPVIYGNVSAFAILLNMSEFEPFDKWIASADASLYFPYAFTYWQYSTSGQIEGISGNVDMDVKVQEN